jgi:peptidoglycan/xylan/chitin deacetylase (PgdA/CDA1 family)
MVGIFILSLDCEGKWGSADKLAEPHVKALTDLTLRRAYRDLLSVLDRYEVPASFAFVSAFAMSRSQQRAARDLFEPLRRAAPWYLDPALADLDHEGWTGDWAVAMTEDATTRHELALHGASHIPWSHLDAATARHEMMLYRDAPSALARRARTFIYPRNDVAHPEILDEFDIAAYRAQKTYAFRGGHLVDEFNPFSPPDAIPADRTRPLVIPPGYFINWRQGARRFVPPWLSLRRADNLLARASTTGDVVHYWTHPENFVSAPDTLALFEGIVARAARARDQGRITIMTQWDFAQSLTKPGSVDSGATDDQIGTI